MKFPTIRNILTLIQSLTAQGADDLERRRQDKPKLMDVAEAQYLTAEARRRNLHLGELIKGPGAAVDRKEVRERVRGKVQSLMSPAFHNNEEIIEEVTEKLTDMATNDPFYKRWFS